MMEWVELGPAPYDENCVQVGDPGYYEQSRRECRVYIDQLYRQFPSLRDDDGPYLKIMSFSHDLGSYHEVVLYYNPHDAKHATLVARIEHHLPARWDDVARHTLNERKEGQ